MHAIRLTGLLGGFGLLVAGPAAQAALVSVEMTGAVTYVNTDYVTDIPLGAPISGSVVYDDALVPMTGAYYLPLDSNSAFGLALRLGPYSFTAADDLDFGNGFPEAIFEGGSFVGIDFVAAMPYGELQVNRDWVPIYNATLSDYVLEGSMSFGPPLPVPLPAAGALLLSGLLGAFGGAWRRSRRT